MLPPYTKIHATAQARVAHLQAMGLTIGKPAVAARKIEQIGYERLRIYFLSRRDTPNRMFRPGTNYNDILKIYDFDAELRSICLIDLALIEVTFRNRMSEALSAQFGSHPYEQLSAFKDVNSRNDVLATALSVYSRSKDRRAKHYGTTYSTPALPPIWTLKEFLTIGQAERVYGNLSSTLRTEIAKEFGVPSRDVFTTWLRCFVDLRNACAHHDRIFNKRFQKQPAILGTANVPTAQPATLKAVLECLDYVLKSVDRRRQRSVVSEVRRVINRCPQVSPAEVGY